MKRKKVMSAALAGALVITMMVPPHLAFAAKRNVSNAYALKATSNTVFISRVPDGQTGQEPME